MVKLDRLTIRNFAQIAQVDISFGDLTVLVGAQGTGKGLALQWLKIAMDGRLVGTAPSQQLQKVAKAALEKTYRVHFLAFDDDGKVQSTDISDLDPEDDDERVSGWGGHTEFSSRFGDAVRDAVNESDR